MGLWTDHWFEEHSMDFCNENKNKNKSYSQEEHDKVSKELYNLLKEELIPLKDNKGK